MGKNTTAQTQDIHVQEDLFEQILNGFKSSSKKGKKNKGTTLSTVQKQRTPLVAQSLLKDTRTNYFTNVWVKQLNPISLKVIDDIIKNIKQLQEEEEEEEEDNIEEDKDDEKKTFSLLTAFKVYRYINTVSHLITTFYAIKRFNQERLSPLTKQLGKLEANKDVQKNVKKLLLMEQLRIFLLQLSRPLTNKLFSIIIGFYDGPKVKKLFDEFEAWMKEEVGKEIAITVGLWVAGIVAGFFSGGTATAATAVATAARWAQFAVKIAKLARVAMKFGSGAAGALDFFYFDNEDAEDFKADIVKIRDEEIAPFVADMNEQIDQFEREVRGLEVRVREAVNEQLDVLGQAENVVEQARKDIEVMNRNRAGIIQVARQRQGEGVGMWSTGHTRVMRIEPNNSEQVSIGMPDSILLIRQHDNTFNEMLKSHSRRYNFTITTQSFDRLMDQSTGLFFVRLINEAIDLVNTHFGKVYQVMDDYIKHIESGYKPAIDAYKLNDQYKHFASELPTELSDVQQYLAERVTIKKNEMGITSSLSTQTQSSAPQQRPTSMGKPWRLSNRTLQPLTPKIINGVLIGIDIMMLDSNDVQQKIKIDKFYGAGDLQQITGRAEQVLLETYTGRRRRYDSEEETTSSEVDYLNYVELFDILNNNKDILKDTELKVEEKTQQLVNELFDKITKEMTR